MSPHVVLATLARLGGRVEPTFVLGCQPATLEEGMTLSPPVSAAVDGAVEMCIELVARNSRTSRKGDIFMIRRVVVLFILGGVAALVYQSLPDIVRYMRIRKM